jgi:hypothetical protein
MVSMATITTNDHAPDETAKFILPLETFDLGPGDSFETTNRNTISNAEVHPWLEVKYPEYDELSTGGRESKSVPAKDDVLSAEGPNGSLAFDPEQIRKDNAEAQVTAPTAIDSGLDQGKNVTDGRIATTLAAGEKAVDEAEADIAAANDDAADSKKSAKKEA